MSWLAIALGIAMPVCWSHTATVTVQDMNGRALKYAAPYWLCQPGARPADPRAMPVCFEDGNPYKRELWAAPWFKQDVAWMCAAEE